MSNETAGFLGALAIIVGTMVVGMILFPFVIRLWFWWCELAHGWIDRWSNDE